MGKINIYSDNERLMRDLQSGCEEAYRYLFATYYPRLQRYAMHFVCDADTVEDILQDSFLRLWERRDALAFTSVQALLFRIVRNKCLNHLRDQAIHERHTVNASAGGEIWESFYNADFFGNSDYELLYHELRRQIESVLGELPERSREIFEISRFEGLKNREIAERLGISVKIVERHIGRALKLLNERFKDMHPCWVQFMLLAWLNQ